MSSSIHLPPCTSRRYRIVVEGKLDTSWSDWLNGIQVKSKKAADGLRVTILQGILEDQAALRGLLNRLWDLNLVLRSVKQVHPVI